jgi:hypothetical protein
MKSSHAGLLKKKKSPRKEFSWGCYFSFAKVYPVFPSMFIRNCKSVLLLFLGICDYVGQRFFSFLVGFSF